MSYTYDYPRPAVTVDALVFSIVNNTLHLLLIQRGREPFKDRWALPGGFVDMDEELEVAVCRELKEETGLDLNNFKQLQAFGKVGRDPRHRTISIAFYCFITDLPSVIGMDDASNAQWFPLKELPELAFDHAEIIQTAVVNLELRF
jgi:8-oxo-dGTP diphosphatase